MTGVITQPSPMRHLARLTFAAFLLTFIASRVLVILIMTRHMPDLFLHRGGSYWQRASFDAVIVVLSVFGLIAFMPRWQRMRAHHFITAGILLIAVASFYWMLFKSLRHADDKLMPYLIGIEQHAPK